MPSGIQVEDVDLRSRGVVLPSDRVGMVIAQPHLSLTAVEPYRCTVDSKDQQLAVVRQTLTVAAAARHGASKTHFTVFPEYSIPGMEGVSLVDAALNESAWPCGTIVIGGTDALSKSDFVTLASADGSHSGRNVLDHIGEREWINCGIIWVKAENGIVERWLQPKLAPAWPEQRVLYQDMFRGKSAFTFLGSLERGGHYRFSLLVCFDWVATIEGKRCWEWIVEDLQSKANQATAEVSLSWFFVIQCNRKPSDDSFLNEVRRFFDQTIFTGVRRERACLVFANSAGKPSPGRSEFFGNSSLVFSAQTLFAEHKNHPTFCTGGQRFRSSTLLSSFHDVLFRESGACIHSFAQVNPNSLAAGAPGKTIALQNAFVFPLNGTSDPRTPSQIVPADVKWLNDELDHVPSFGTRYSAAPLALLANSVHCQLLTLLRTIAPQATTGFVRLATQQSTAEHADEWGALETAAVEHVVHTISILGVGCIPFAVANDALHATVTVKNQAVSLVAIRGVSHESCIEHSKRFPTSPRCPVLLVSRDQDNTIWNPRFGSILEQQPSFRCERKFTDPRSGVVQIGFQELFEIFRASPAATVVEGAINAQLNA